MKTLRIFVCSPGDVVEERTLAYRVIERLRSEFAGRLVIEPVLWEHEPLLATASFQSQIVRPSETDIVISIFWSRLGTPLPTEFVRDDGTHYQSGTEYEFEEAVGSYRRNGKPEILVYRKTIAPSVRLDDEATLLRRLQQKKAVDEFLDKWFHNADAEAFIGAYHGFESAHDFEELVERHLRKLVEQHLPGAAADEPAIPAVWRHGSPFRGLNAFEREHAPVFFGRTRAITGILQALREQAALDRAFVMVLGMSGGGKSSVVSAGVLPMLTEAGVIEGVGTWRWESMRPSDFRGNPADGLAAALTQDHALPGLAQNGSSRAELAEVFRSSPTAAAALIKQALSQTSEQQSTRPERLILVVDQMEELFTLDAIDAAGRESFVDVIDALARSGSVWVIATLRSDFYPRCAELVRLVALKKGAGQYDLPPPGAAEIGQMIRLPARAAGLRFATDPETGEDLDERLRDAAAGHPEVLPLLQFTLEELYERRSDNGTLTFAAYDEIGGVEGSLARRAEAVFQQLPPAVQTALPRVLNAMVTFDSQADETVGRKRISYETIKTRDAQALVEAFINARLFVSELADDGSAQATVTHEALLRHWPRVRDWIAENREHIRIQSRVSAAAARWQSEGRNNDLLLPHGKPLDEGLELSKRDDIELNSLEHRFIEASNKRARRIERLKLGVAVMLAVLAVAAGTAALVANQQRQLADSERERAETEATAARETTSFLVRLFEVSDPHEARGETITVNEILDTGAARIEEELADQPQIQSTLKGTIGQVYASLGAYELARGLLQDALASSKALYGAEHLEVARNANRLGLVAFLQTELDEAVELHTEALDIRRRCSETSISTWPKVCRVSPMRTTTKPNSSEPKPCCARRWQCEPGCWVTGTSSSPQPGPTWGASYTAPMTTTTPRPCFVLRSTFSADCLAIGTRNWRRY